MSKKLMPLTASILIIGNEILSGRTQDKNIQFIAKHLQSTGIRLVEVRIVQDVENEIIEALNALRAKYTYVFTTGGIGGTHDDITAESVSKAFGVPYEKNHDAFKIIANAYQDNFTSVHLRLSMMPKGAGLIDNPIGKVPGFFIENVYCMAGIPATMQSMFETILPTLKKGEPFISRTITCKFLYESQIADKLTAIQNNFPNVEIGSYPFYEESGKGVSLVVKGQKEQDVNLAKEAILQMVYNFNIKPIIE